MVGNSNNIDESTRRRITAWFRYCYSKYRHVYPTKSAFADALELSGATVTNILNGKRTPGLDVVIRLHRKFHLSLDIICDTDPPELSAGVINN